MNVLERGEYAVLMAFNTVAVLLQDCWLLLAVYPECYFHRQNNPRQLTREEMCSIQAYRVLRRWTNAGATELSITRVTRKKRKGQ